MIKPPVANKPQYIIATLLLLLLSYGLYVQIKHLIDSYKWVNHTNVVELKLEQTLSYAKDEESSQRGFLLTRDSSFLEPYFTSQKKMQQSLADIKELTADNMEQQQNIAALASLIDLRFRMFNYTIANYFDTYTSDSAKNGYLLNGKQMMDKMRILVAHMQSIENSLLFDREHKKNIDVWLTPLLASAFILFSMALLTISYIRARRNLENSRKDALQLQQLNEELTQKNTQLQITNSELDSFNYIASHDLREPLRKIQTYSEIILLNQPQHVTESIRQNLNKIIKSTQRMKGLLEDLLAYSRVAATDQQTSEVNLNTILEEVIENLQEQIDETKAHIEVKNLPVITGISFQLHQLFENLVSNSIKYRHKDRAPHIIISGSLLTKEDMNARANYPQGDAAAYYRVVYTDNGIGFPQQYADKVFNLFQRLHANEGYAGTGIGLTICKRVVQNHHGFIMVQSKEEEGTTFEILLPAELPI